MRREDLDNGFVVIEWITFSPKLMKTEKEREWRWQLCNFIAVPLRDATTQHKMLSRMLIKMAFFSKTYYSAEVRNEFAWIKFKLELTRRREKPKLFSIWNEILFVIILRVAHSTHSFETTEIFCITCKKSKKSKHSLHSRMYAYCFLKYIFYNWSAQVQPSRSVLLSLCTTVLKGKTK